MWMEDVGRYIVVFVVRVSVRVAQFSILVSKMFIESQLMICIGCLKVLDLSDNPHGLEGLRCMLRQFLDPNCVPTP